MAEMPPTKLKGLEGAVMTGIEGEDVRRIIQMTSSQPVSLNQNAFGSPNFTTLRLVLDPPSIRSISPSLLKSTTFHNVFKGSQTTSQ